MKVFNEDGILEKRKNPNRIKIGGFWVTVGARTKQGELHTTRLITKDHSIYPHFFNEDGSPKKHDEQKGDEPLE